LKKIETNSNHTYNKILNLKLRTGINESPFRTINTDTDEIGKSMKLKSNSRKNESSNKISNNRNTTNSFISIHDEYAEKENNYNQNKVYVASDNLSNLEIISKVNNFNKVLNLEYKKTKSNSEFDVNKFHIIDNGNSLNSLKENKFLQVNPANKTFSNNFYTIDRFSSIEYDRNTINSNLNPNDIRYKLVKKNIKDINNHRINSRIVHNYSINPSSDFISSQTINTDNHIRSFSEIRPKKESQALTDLSRILQNKSVEKLTNMKFENLELKNTKEGINIIDKLINNLTRLKTIMIEEEDKKNQDM
jgi:hypothetical protein